MHVSDVLSQNHQLLVQKKLQECMTKDLQNRRILCSSSTALFSMAVMASHYISSDFFFNHTSSQSSISWVCMMTEMILRRVFGSAFLK